MASEYLKWKYRNEKPAEKIELTKQQKRRNWWHYHKWHVIVGALLLCAAGNILYNVLGIGEIRPDYQIAYVGSSILPDEAVAALEGALADLADDANGDGQVSVKLHQYADTSDRGSADAAYYAMAASVKLMADITDRLSYFFLLDDPETFQQNYHALRRLDGTLPPELDQDWENCCLRWADCPVLAGLDLGAYEEDLLTEQRSGEVQELLNDLYIARRGFWTEAASANAEACDVLWERFTEGTVS